LIDFIFCAKGAMRSVAGRETSGTNPQQILPRLPVRWEEFLRASSMRGKLASLTRRITSGYLLIAASRQIKGFSNKKHNGRVNDISFYFRKE
jgi:hypothetical protein